VFESCFWSSNGAEKIESATDINHDILRQKNMIKLRALLCHKCCHANNEDESGHPSPLFVAVELQLSTDVSRNSIRIYDVVARAGEQHLEHNGASSGSSKSVTTSQGHVVGWPGRFDILGYRYLEGGE
jgi:hypothetical protein